MRYLIIIIYCLASQLFGNIFDIPKQGQTEIKGKFAKNKKCIRCHLDIYLEFKKSSHHLSSITNNTLHKAMWKRNPLNRKNAYVCAECHTPAAENIDAMMAEGADFNMSEPSLDEGVSCAMCHRIIDIDRTHKVDHYILSPKKLHYQGARKNQQSSEFHEIELGNKYFKNANMCLTCHAQHKKEKNLVIGRGCYCVFSPVDENISKLNENTKEENCISCHMPQVSGSHSDRVSALTHASHTFAALKNKIAEPERFIKFNMTKTDNGFKVDIINKIPHNLIQHPTRQFVLKVFVNDKLIKEHKIEKPDIESDAEAFTWLEKTVTYKENLMAKGRMSVQVEHQLKEKDEVSVELGYYILKPKLATMLDLEEEQFSKYRIFIKKTKLKGIK